MVAERLEEIKSGKFQKMKDPQKLKHFRFEIIIILCFKTVFDRL